MRDIVCVRTLNEEHRIGQFCKSYEKSWRVLVADGGSLDNTVEIAKSFPNVEIHHYTKRVQLQGDHWRNNDSDHANFLFGLAYSLKPDWIIFDDCDCRPNYLLKQDYRKILAETDKNFVMVTRLFVGENGKHYTYLAKPNHVDYEPSLWAWRGNLDFWTVDVPPAFIFRIGDKHVHNIREEGVLELMPPYCLLHYSWDDSEKVEKKVKYYRESGFIPNQKYPSEYESPLEDLPDFAHE